MMTANNYLHVMQLRATHCVTHHDACDCREYAHASRIAELKADRDTTIARQAREIDRLNSLIGGALIRLKRIGPVKADDHVGPIYGSFEAQAAEAAKGGG